VSGLPSPGAPLRCRALLPPLCPHLPLPAVRAHPLPTPCWASTASLANVCKSTDSKVRAVLAPVAPAIRTAFTQAAASSYSPLSLAGSEGLDVCRV
jgi:hypothetical protein